MKMVLSCTICYNKHNITLQRTLHRLPTDFKIRKEWLRILNIDSTDSRIDNIRVCSDHFNVSCFKKKEKRTRLLKGSVPTIGILERTPFNVESHKCSPSVESSFSAESSSTLTADETRMILGTVEPISTTPSVVPLCELEIENLSSNVSIKQANTESSEDSLYKSKTSPVVLKRNLQSPPKMESTEPPVKRSRLKNIRYPGDFSTDSDLMDSFHLRQKYNMLPRKC